MLPGSVTDAIAFLIPAGPRWTEYCSRRDPFTTAGPRARSAVPGAPITAISVLGSVKTPPVPKLLELDELFPTSIDTHDFPGTIAPTRGPML